ncbi:MAG: hypothetical protein Q8O05_00955, partial [Chloroflexota bacterium]|nr:hypothetical protein [Chloroflexota bacterium]
GDLASLQADVDKLLKQRTALDPTVTGLLARQIRATLNQQGIYNPADRYVKLPVNFPPLAFKLTVPPHELIVSPRDRIETIRRMTLQPNMDVRQMESVEEQVDKLGVSSLVVELGGLGTYPSFVTDDADLRFTAETIAHEWTHQYLAFTPLGIRYVFDVMGVVQNYDIATMNETVANMVGKEISDIVYQKYYPGQGAPPKPAPAFDFNAAMRDIRRAVDQYLAKGDIDQAEAFMEQQRQFLASKGYYIRKLNQAYFAFHGTYADSPTSISPIGVELRELRRKSVSLKDFLDTAAVMTSRQDLQLILQKGSTGS